MVALEGAVGGTAGGFPWLCQQDGGRSPPRRRPSEREDLPVATGSRKWPTWTRALQNGGGCRLAMMVEMVFVGGVHLDGGCGAMGAAAVGSIRMRGRGHHGGREWPPRRSVWWNRGSCHHGAWDGAWGTLEEIPRRWFLGSKYQCFSLTPRSGGSLRGRQRAEMKCPGAAQPCAFLAHEPEAPGNSRKRWEDP